MCSFPSLLFVYILEFHPDKNKAPGAAEVFHKVKHAFDVITDKDLKREYNRLGELGVKLVSHKSNNNNGGDVLSGGGGGGGGGGGMVIDHKYLLLQLIVYYASSLIFAFLMTFSEPTSEALSLSVFGLTGA